MTVDQTVPGDKWVFDADVTDAFDDMLARSIPAYNTMRELTTALARSFVVEQTDVLDLGCSRGQALAPLVADHVEGVRYIGTDISEPMLAAAKSRFAHEGQVHIAHNDLRTGYPPVQTSVTLAILTLQFTPIEYRQRILQDVFDSTIPGGVLLVVEKVLGAGAQLHDVFDREYLRFKAGNAYTQEQIERKKASLEGVLVSLTASHNEQLLRQVGFRYVDCYYRWLNFAGWIAVR